MGMATLGAPRARAASPNGKLRVLSIGTVGTIGASDRTDISKHPMAEITGLCDVNSTNLAQSALDHPSAFTCKDYREAFAKYGDRFDAVIVSTPDHSHAPILLTAMAANKHVYGQKPLVHQLEELTMVERAITAKPDLVTQLGNQRMAKPGRRAAVEILRQGMLGKALEAYVWTDSPNSRDYFNLDRKIEPAVPPPADLDWDLWLCATKYTPYRPGIAPIVWRSWWDYGSNGLGDWGCHLLDVIFHAYDELVSPVAVQTQCAKVDNPAFHANPCHSTITYAVNSPHFAHKDFPIYYNDSGNAPSRMALGLPPGKWVANDMTVVVCENGLLALTAEGKLEIWRDGQMTDGLKMPGLPAFPPLNHRHAWVDNCLGIKTELRTPFRDALRMTEAILLAVKAARFPRQELYWDKAQLAFTNNAEATKTIVRRNYRDGFAPPTF